MQWQVIYRYAINIRYEKCYNNFRTDNYYFFDKNNVYMLKYTIHTYTYI